jgi:response regulator NasT
MSDGLRIAIADDERDMRDYFARVLPSLGHEIVAVAANGRELIEKCRATRPDLLILDIRMPEMDGLAALEELCREECLPSILVSGYSDPEFVRRAEECGVMAYLVKPVKLAELGPAIALAMRRFEQLHALREEARDLRQSLEDRKVVERAKGILILRLRLNEAEAFRQMQKLAMQSNRKLIDVAQEILESESL